MSETLPPIVYATIQACILNATSNIIAQVLSAYRTGASYTIDWTPVLQFIVFTALNTPPNFLWQVSSPRFCADLLTLCRQSFIEERFPSTHLVPSKSALTAAATNDEKELDREQRTSEIFESKLSKSNTLVKFLLDQTLGSGVNTLIFLIGFGGISGKTWNQSVASVREEFWGLIFAGWKLWPLVSFFNFAIIKSVEVRGLVGCLAGMVWGIYLSLNQG